MTQAAIKKQIEFYFSDSNYRKDTFLKTLADSDPQGFVPISVILSFNKIKALTSNTDDILEALSTSDSVIISDDKTSLRRSHPLPEGDDFKSKTLYVKGYPIDDPDVTIESIHDEFSKFGKVNLVRLRRNLTKGFKGSVFIEFDKVESVQAACDAANVSGSNEVQLSYKTIPFVKVCSFNDWIAEKASQKAAKAAEKVVQVGTKRKIEDESTTETYVHGLVLRVDKIPENTSYRHIKETLNKYGDVQFVEYNEGDSFAILRVGNLESAEKITKAASEGIKLAEGDENVVVSVVSGAEEDEYWKKYLNRNKNSGSRRGRGHFKRRR